MLKDTGSKPSPDLPVVAWQRAGLRQQVAEAFEGRQQLQRAELDWHRQRLARIEQQIAEREPIKDQVIDRRVDELLNPNLQWDPSKLQAAPAVSGAPAFAGPLTSTEPIDISTKNTNFKPKGTSDPFQAEKEQRTRKNLQQLALAMHNYHDVRFNFPPAVVMSPDGKTPHSWRVELLPFLGETDLYQRYRKDEPWDSPHNEDLFKWLPDVFRSPYDDPHSTNSGYYALVGPGTVFEKGPHGVKISDITDGTSNTLLVVEARRNIPWTKPDDISFDPDKPVPEWGGFVKGKFAAALADGSVHIFDREKVDSILKWMIIRNDMQPITIPIP